MTDGRTSPASEVPGVYREFFESALLAYFRNQPELNREILSRASQKALVDGRLDYHAFFQGELSFAENNLPDALKNYDIALSKSPDNTLFLANKAAVLVLMGDAHQAIPLLERSIRLNPQERHAHAGLITAFAELGEVKRAKHLLDDLLRVPKLESIHKFHILTALVDFDREKKALQIIDELLGEDPDNIYCTNLKTCIESKLIARRSREYSRRPYLRALLTCDSVRTVNGKPHCEGVFDFLNLLAFPSNAPKFCVFISFLSRKIGSSVDILFRDNRGRTVFRHSTRAHTADMRGATYVVAEVSSLNVPAAGPYLLEAHVDKKKIGSVPFVVKKREPRPDFSAEELRSLLQDPNVAKHVKVSFNCGKCQKAFVLQMNLDPNAPIDEDAMPFPSTDELICRQCGQRIDTKPFRLQARQALGTRLDQPSSRKKE